MENQNKKVEFDRSSPLQSYAYEWLKRQGLFDDDSDYGGMLGDAVFELIKVFSKQGHSGFSARITRALFNRLLDDYEKTK